MLDRRAGVRGGLRFVPREQADEGEESERGDQQLLVGSRDLDGGLCLAQRLADVVVRVQGPGHLQHRALRGADEVRIGRAGEHEQAPDLRRRPPADVCGADAGDQGPRAGDQLRARDGRRPAHERAAAAGANEVERMVLDQLQQRADVAGRAGVLGGVLDEPVLAGPAQGPPAHGVRVRPFDFGEQVIPQERVIAIPARSVDERDHEEVGPFERPQFVPRARPLEDRVAELSAQLRQHRRALQELPRVGTQVAQHFAGQVPRDVALGAAERAQRRRRVAALAQPQRSEIEQPGPSLRTPGQRCDGRLVRRGAGHRREQLLRLGHRERQVVGADLDELALRAQPRQPQRRNRARDQHELHVLGQRRDGVVERAQAALVADRVHVVDYENDRALVRGKPDRERLDRRQDHADGVAQLRERVGTGARAHPLDRRGERRPQPHGVVVAGVGAHPRCGVPTLGQPQLHRDRLPIARRRHNQRQRRLPAAVERTAQAGSRDDPAPQPGRRQPARRVHAGKAAAEPGDRASFETGERRGGGLRIPSGRRLRAPVDAGCCPFRTRVRYFATVAATAMVSRDRLAASFRSS